MKGDVDQYIMWLIILAIIVIVIVALFYFYGYNLIKGLLQKGLLGQ